MVFKVYYQKDFSQAPVRETTNALFIEGESESDVRRKLAPREYNIEFVTQLSDAHLAYEQKYEDFNLETL
ncbi:DNA-dependent RNA polymerase subunit epsilon [Shouchella shacheensis]|uniref:DNA-dependent RNA polymerase subunit epsilon n=1 Tax=Shouchella shacheensis TaxID=1649580 RepID=UPI00074054E8|nr:DNA-directed RNA polymerase subunit epsilon [Shouchella shacheensis]